jgi:hypothetical protein
MPLYQQGGLGAKGGLQGTDEIVMNFLRAKALKQKMDLENQQMDITQQKLPYEMDYLKSRADYYNSHPFSAPSSNYRIVSIKDPLTEETKVFRVPISPGGQPEEILKGRGLFSYGEESRPQPKTPTPQQPARPQVPPAKPQFDKSGFTKPRQQPGKFIQPQETQQKSPYPEYPDAFFEDGKWKVIRNGKKYRIEE